MRIRRWGKWVCGTCWADWKTYHGLDGREAAQCEWCGEGIYTGDNYSEEDLEQWAAEESPMNEKNKD